MVLRAAPFEDHSTAGLLDRVPPQKRLRHFKTDLATGPWHLLARHVLEDSGTVGWADKCDVYQLAVTVAELRPAVFRALLAGYHAVYGSLDPAEALALLARLHLSADTEHLTQLATVLRKGIANHFDDPTAWSG